MAIALRVLLLEDDDDDAALTLRALTRGDFEIVAQRRIETADQFREQLSAATWDVVLSDYRMPRFTAPEALEILQQHMRETGLDLPFIVISGTIGEETAVTLMKAGAADYLLKGNLRRLCPAIEREMREAEGRRHRRAAESALREAEARQQAFIRDVLHGVTQGRLRLCDSEQQLPEALPAVGEPIGLSPETLSHLRTATRQAAAEQDLPSERVDDLLTASGEVAMNAVVHGGGGTARVHGGGGTVQVWVKDHGVGIDVQRLPRATLERGYSSAGTLGHGFFLVLSTVDRTWLRTGKQGTTVVVEQDQAPLEPAWLTGLTLAA